MARDILAVPVSIVSSDSAFSTSGQVLDQFHSSLGPKIVKTLMCLRLVESIHHLHWCWATYGLYGEIWSRYLYIYTSHLLLHFIVISIEPWFLTSLWFDVDTWVGERYLKLIKLWLIKEEPKLETFLLSRYFPNSLWHSIIRFWISFLKFYLLDFWTLIYSFLGQKLHRMLGWVELWSCCFAWWPLLRSYTWS